MLKWMARGGVFGAVIGGLLAFAACAIFPPLAALVVPAVVAGAFSGSMMGGAAKVTSKVAKFGFATAASLGVMGLAAFAVKKITGHNFGGTQGANGQGTGTSGNNAGVPGAGTDTRLTSLQARQDATFKQVNAIRRQCGLDPIKKPPTLSAGTIAQWEQETAAHARGLEQAYLKDPNNGAVEYGRKIQAMEAQRYGAPVGSVAGMGDESRAAAVSAATGAPSLADRKAASAAAGEDLSVPIVDMTGQRKPPAAGAVRLDEPAPSKGTRTSVVVGDAAGAPAAPPPTVRPAAAQAQQARA